MVGQTISHYQILDFGLAKFAGQTRLTKTGTTITLSFEADIWQDGISMTPDGKRIVCNVVELQSDVWLMENFDPEVE